MGLKGAAIAYDVSFLLAFLLFRFAFSIYHDLKVMASFYTDNLFAGIKDFGIQTTYSVGTQGLQMLLYVIMSFVASSFSVDSSLAITIINLFSPILLMQFMAI